MVGRTLQSGTYPGSWIIAATPKETIPQVRIPCLRVQILHLSISLRRWTERTTEFAQITKKLQRTKIFFTNWDSSRSDWLAWSLAIDYMIRSILAPPTGLIPRLQSKTSRKHCMYSNLSLGFKANSIWINLIRSVDHLLQFY